jgi:hypothetical protein
MSGLTGEEPHYEAFGWHQWLDDVWISYQFRRGLGETQEGGGAVGEAFPAAGRWIGLAMCSASIRQSRIFTQAETTTLATFDLGR